MGKTFGFNASNDQILQICNNFGIREEEIGKCLKKVALSPDKLFQQIRKDLDIPNNNNNDESESLIPTKDPKDMSIQELKDELNIKPQSLGKKIKSKGLYFKKNVEDYMADFMQYWNGDLYKIDEICLQLKLFERGEFVTRELLDRAKIL